MPRKLLLSCIRIEAHYLYKLLGGVNTRKKYLSYVKL